MVLGWLPTTFFNTWYMSFVCRFTEANTTHIKVAHVSTLSSALETSPDDLTFELWYTECTQDDWFFCHRYALLINSSLILLRNSDSDTVRGVSEACDQTVENLPCVEQTNETTMKCAECGFSEAGEPFHRESVTTLTSRDTQKTRFPPIHHRRWSGRRVYMYPKLVKHESMRNIATRRIYQNKGSESTKARMV